MYTSMFRKAMLGDTATLNLDFTTGVLDSRFTFTRASTATYINSSGYVTTMGAAPTNDPTKSRFDYDPVTLAPRGLLIEAQTTNVVTNSNALNNAGGLTRTYPTGILSPDGTENAQKFTKSDATTPRYIFPATLFTVAASTVYTVSIWIKYDGFAFTTKIQYNNTANFDGIWSAEFVITAGGITVGTRTGICSASNVETYPNGWYRCSATLTSGAAPTGVNPGFLIDVVGTTGVSVLVYGAQLEAGSGASSYIPTGASGVTRNADGVVMNDISSLGYSTQVGSIYWSGIINKQPIAYSTLIGFMTAGDQPTFETFGNALNYFSAARGSGLSAGGPNEVARPYTLGSNIRYASSVNTLVNPIVQVNLNGSANSTTKTGTGDMYLATRFVIGRGASYVLNYPSVTIKQIRYYPEFKTAAQLQALTAP